MRLSLYGVQGNLNFAISLLYAPARRIRFAAAENRLKNYRNSAVRRTFYRQLLRIGGYSLLKRIELFNHIAGFRIAQFRKDGQRQDFIGASL